jgi:HSP20 family protein
MRNPFDLLQRQIDRIFDDFSTGSRMPDLFSDSSSSGLDLLPSVDVHETDNALMVTAELPGVDEKDVEITVADQMLTISGEKKSEREDKRGGTYRSERSYGMFSRTINLPFDIDPDKVEAKFDRGVLTLTIPKPANARSNVKKIPIKH